MRTTPEQMINELKREFQTRKKVYPKLIRFGKLGVSVATKRMEILSDAIKYIENQSKQNKGDQGNLFK